MLRFTLIALMLAIGTPSTVTFAQDAATSTADVATTDKGQLTLLCMTRSGKHSAYLDDQPLALFPGDSYLTFEVEPGLHVLWGTKGASPTWLTIDPGQRHLLLLVGDRQNSTWCLEDPNKFPLFQQGTKLRPADTTPKAMEKLAKKFKPKDLEKARKKAGEQPGSEFPVTFKGIHHKEKLGAIANPFSMAGYGGGGKELLIDAERLTYHGETPLTIPVADIRIVTFAGSQHGQRNVWLAVAYGEPDLQMAYFSPNSMDNYNRMFETIRRALLASGWDTWEMRGDENGDAASEATSEDAEASEDEDQP